jgi:hypothetical protein
VLTMKQGTTCTAPRHLSAACANPLLRISHTRTIEESINALSPPFGRVDVFVKGAVPWCDALPECRIFRCCL